MKILIRKTNIIGTNNTLQGPLDIFLNNGKIEAIGTLQDIQPDKIIEGDGLTLSPGWVEIFSDFSDPGYEQKETMASGACAAAKGGFTDVFVIPNTRPVLDSKAQIEYVRTRSAQLPVNVYPIGAISHGTSGKDLSEMYDMYQSGAIAFSDGLHPVQSSGILLKALQYIRAFNGVIIQVPDDITIGPTGLMNEGIISTTLGLPGKPMIAEEVIIARDLKILEYTGSRIHFTGVTSPESIRLIQEAKGKGLDVTCSVTPHHLFFTDADLMNYDTNLKVYPHLRSAEVRDELRKAVLDGTIDCIATHHIPHDIDSKDIEFEFAAYGMIGLETCFNLLVTSLPGISEERIAQLLSLNPRKIFGMAVPEIKEGADACFTLFSKNGVQHIRQEYFASKSRNTPLMGKELSGTVYGIINKDVVFLNH